MMKLWEPLPGTPADVAIARKRLLPSVDSVVSDERLVAAVHAHLAEEHARLNKPGADPDGERLSLVSALWAAREVAETLDLQLSFLLPLISERAVGQLRDELPNRSTGLLHTMSELGLSLEFLRQGYEISCAHPFWGDRDVDVATRKDGEVRLVEVVNVQASPARNTTSGFLPFGGVPDLTRRLVAKVSNKVKKKFRSAVEGGWTDRAWVAVDPSKDHLLYVNLAILDRHDPGWRDAVAKELAPQFPELAGVLFYTYSAGHPVASDLRWHPC
ncbi:MAG: hypothetical protein Q8P18_28160 [Pseudomonadota bacterium]|nr:hypothetical protein [Pseudomonadota bacterium]